MIGNETTKTYPTKVCRFVYHFVLPSKSRDRVLGEILPHGVGRLPRIELPAGVDCSESKEEGPLETWIEAKLGISVCHMRKLGNGNNERMEGADCVNINYLYLGDVAGDERVVRKPLEWIHRIVACEMKWVVTNGDWDNNHIGRQVKLMFEEINGETPFVHTQAWEKDEWFEELTMWSRNMLKTRNMVIQGTIEDVCCTPQSMVMRCEAKRQDERKLKEKESCELIYIKCTLPLVREVERTVAVASVIGDIVPEIICVNEREGILMQRNGGAVTDETFDQEALIDTILKVQVLSMSRISELEAGGLRVRDSEWVESNVESILNHELLEEYSRKGSPDMAGNEVERELVDDLRSRVGEIQKMCRKITKLGLPRTIVHGDLSLHNIGSPVGREKKMYRVFDWATSFIGNPLHDFGKLLGNPDTGFDSDFPGVLRNWEGGVKQVWKQWKPCAILTMEETKTVFEILGGMFTLIQIHDLTEQYDVSNDTKGDEKIRILRELDIWMSLLLI